jgi:hypothetical protein
LQASTGGVRYAATIPKWRCERKDFIYFVISETF